MEGGREGCQGMIILHVSKCGEKRLTCAANGEKEEEEEE